MLFCSLHYGVGDVFDPTARLMGVDAPNYLARVNFGPERTRAVPGYAKDSGLSFGPRTAGLSYGWTENEPESGKVRRSLRSQDDRYDSFLVTPASGATWELDAPNGIYTVRIASGDARSTKGSFAFSVEGITAINGSVSKQQRWLETTLTVAVTDGRLTVESLAGAKPGKINFIDVAVSGSQELSSPAVPPAATSGNGRAVEGPVLGSLTLVNAQTDQDIALLSDGATLDLASIGNQLTLRANAVGAIGSVQFVLDGGTPTIDSAAPFAIAGDLAGDYLAWTPTIGAHTLVVTPFSGPGGTDVAGAAYTVIFTVVDSGPVSPPPVSPPPPESPPPVSPPPPPVSPPPVSPPVSPPPVTSGININFQPSTASTVSGYQVDSGGLYGDRNGLTYGWTTSHTDSAIDRDVAADQLVDTYVAVKAGARWELAVPNGQYTVKVSVGDAAAATRQNLWVENVWHYNYVNLAANQFAAVPVNVTVTDGRLSLAIGGAATGATRINYIEVTSATTSPPVSPPPVSPPPVSPPPVSPPPVSPPPVSPPPPPPVSPPVSPPPVTSGININFQPSTASTVSGYQVDSGGLYGDRNGLTYGWTTSHTDSAIDRDVAADQLVDTYVAVKAGARWELAVPNGQYTVKVSVGDAAAATRQNLWVENVWHYNYVNLAANQFAAVPVNVTVTDGRLSLAIGGAATGATRINYIEVTSATTSPPVSPPPVSPPPVSPPPVSPPPVSPPPASPPPVSPPPVSPPSGAVPIKVNFQPATAPTAAGYVIDSGEVYGSRGTLSYGWSTSHTDAVFDRNVNADQVLDTQVAVKAASKWELAVPNGQYTVAVGVGDSSAASRDNVWIEGNWHYQYVTLGANQFLKNPKVVTVNDGRLTLEFGQSPTGETRMTSIEVLAVSPPPSPPSGPPSPPALNAIGLSLINSTTDQSLGALTNNMTIDMRQVGSRLNIEAVPASPVGSLVFYIDGKNVTTQTDTPYSLGEDPGYRKFSDWTPTAGAHELRVVPYTGADGTGTAGEATVIRFTVIDLNGSAQTPTALPVGFNWTTVTNGPVNRAESLGTLVNGKLYVFGGLDGSVVPGTANFVAMKRADVFNPATNTWTRIADVPEALTHTSSVVVGDAIWFVGGYTGNQPVGGGHNRVNIYNTTTNAWSRGPNLPVAQGAGGATVIGNTIYFVAGTNAARTASVGDTYKLNLSQQSQGWKKVASLPTPRNHLAVYAIGGKLYAIGGQTGQQSTNAPLSLVHQYDPLTNVWKQVASLPSARTHTTNAVFAYRGRMVIVGGENGYDNPQRDLLAYDPAYDTWTIIGQLPENRSTAVAGLLPDGRFISSTGNNPGASKTTWIGSPVFA
ncbi:Kelch repeat-containing protein [Humisphaera borealis]|uniref:Malectin domain-containing protein n=1 Tax=Humisphaera borealis TaxID=2807512 RepID=A0A7M2WX37_9BACT|nr:kelch repeat-containing protein [Humisphaera borealis]QOV89969.1 hypothetical protein IPV69_00935 [Humisphaera borealis]